MANNGITLTREHRRDQTRLRLATASQITNIWNSVYDISDIRRSFDALTLQAIPTLLDNHLQSTQLAADYYVNHRQVNGVAGRFAPVKADELNQRRAKDSLEYMARIGVLKAIGNGRTPEEAARAGLVNTIGESERLVGEGGRQTVARSTIEDPQTRGFERITGGSPCEFCALLASRGPAFKTESSADFEAHRHCNCEAAPVYSDWQPSPEQQQWQELYNEVAKGQDEPMKRFRAAYRERYSK